MDGLEAVCRGLFDGKHRSVNYCADDWCMCMYEAKDS